MMQINPCEFIFVRKRWWHTWLEKMAKPKNVTSDLLLGVVTASFEMRVNSRGKIYSHPQSIQNTVETKPGLVYNRKERRRLKKKG